MKLLSKIKKKSIVVGVLGLGYVGLPIVQSLNKNKIRVIGFDTDKNKIKHLNNFESYIISISNSLIKKYIENKLFFPTSDFKYLNDVDIIVICVPTPLKNNYLPDLKYIKNSVNIIKKFRKKEQLIILESTTYPETTTEELVKKLSDKEYELGKNFYVGYSPEREDPGNKKYNNTNIPKIISAEDSKSLTIIEKFYKLYISDVVKVKNTKTAETVKLFENVFRAVNIALVNELKIILRKLDINMWDVVDAAKTKPFGFMPFYPGPGFGGHCIPIDPFYLSWKAKQIGQKTEFIKLAGLINRQMPEYIYNSIIKYFNKKKIKLKNILIIGLSYKKDVPDIRESPSLHIIKEFSKNKIKTDFFDPYFYRIPQNSIFNTKNKSITLTKKNIIKYDALLIVTDHTDIDYKLMTKYSKVIFDTRNIIRIQKDNIINL